MNIFFFTDSKSLSKVSEIINYLKNYSKEDKVFLVSDKINNEIFEKKKVDIIISRHNSLIIPKEILNLANNRAINFHTSLLPMNKGCFPILWATLKNTPYGVSIHQMNEGVDEGKVYSQKKISVSSKMTLERIYDFHEQEITKLFYNFWPSYRKSIAKNEEFLKFIDQDSKKHSSHSFKESQNEIKKLKYKWKTTAEEARKNWVNSQ